jgi:hypothetical protein
LSWGDRFARMVVIGSPGGWVEAILACGVGEWVEAIDRPLSGGLPVAACGCDSRYICLDDAGVVRSVEQLVGGKPIQFNSVPTVQSSIPTVPIFRKSVTFAVIIVIPSAIAMALFPVAISCDRAVAAAEFPLRLLPKPLPQTGLRSPLRDDRKSPRMPGGWDDSFQERWDSSGFIPQCCS